MVGPAAKAIKAAEGGRRFELHASQVKPGCVVWMPWAGVIKVTHKMRCRGRGDGVEVVGHSAGDRPRRRAWNHPAVIIKRDGEMVYILPLTSFKGKTMDQKLAKLSEQGRTKLVAQTIPVAPAPHHPLFKAGDTQYKTLSFHPGSQTSRPGYVKLDTIYKMDWKDLERYPKHAKENCRLDDDCVKRLLDLTKRLNSRSWRSMMGESADTEAENE